MASGRHSKAGVCGVRTILYGPVTKAHLDDASLFSGIQPTEFVTDGSRNPPASNLSTLVVPVDPMVPGEAGERQKHWRMVLNADALVCVEENSHLVYAAEKFGCVVYQPDST